MIRRKPVFIIPGFKQRSQNKAYKEIAKILKTEGYFPIPVSIPWRQTTISQNTEYFLKKYKKINARKKYILGFSFGAMIAFIASTKVNVSGLILCSLSPYFREDLPKVNSRWNSLITPQRYEDFSNLHCATLSKQIKAKKTLLLYGSREAKSLIKRVKCAFYQISSPQKILISVKETDHNIGDRRYLYMIHKAAKNLN